MAVNSLTQHCLGNHILRCPSSPPRKLPNIVEVPSSAVSCLVTASVAARAGHCLRDNSATAAGPSTLIALQATLAKGVVFIT